MHISSSDINKRVNSLNVNHIKSDLNINSLSPITAGVYVNENARFMINHWQNFSENTNTAFNKALDVFDVVCEHGTQNDIREAKEILIEGVQKVRDANQLLNSIKYRNSRIKSKIGTKVTNKLADLGNNEVNDRIRSAINSLKGVTPSSGGQGASASDEYKSEMTLEAYKQLEDKAHAVYECDRILRNYNNISKRFDLMKMVSESLAIDGDIDGCIVKMCECIDTYNSAFPSKYNTMLETTHYVLSRLHVEYPKSKIVEMVTDYFIFTDTPIAEAEIDGIKKVKSTSVMFDGCDFDSIEYLIKSSPGQIKEQVLDRDAVIEAVGLYGAEDVVITEGPIKDKIKDWSKGNRDSAANTTQLKTLVNKIFTKNATQITTELPNIFSIIRLFFVLGSAAIHPVIGIVAAITNWIIKIELERKQLEKLISQYEKEIEKVKGSIEKAKAADEKDRLNKYLDELKKDMEKLKEYERGLYSEEENDEKDMEDYDFDDDFDFGMDDDDDWDLEDFDESTVSLASIEYISDLVSNINEGLLDTDLDGIIYSNIFRFDNDTIDAVTDFSITVPVILEKNKLKEALISHREQLRESDFMGNLLRIECLNENIHRLSSSSQSYNVTNNTKGLICTLNCVNDIVTTVKCQTLMEMNFSNTIKLAMNKLKKTAVGLSDKEKAISKDIDVSMVSISRGLEDALRNDSREAIIKGRILPSASKTIKIALATGAAWAVSPAVAVIGAIGAFACSTKLKAKERQLVLDDIEIELKMCERYLRMAEDKGDMKAVRQIEITQRNLERQRQRIKYKMNVVYNQRVPDTVKDDYE